MAASGHVNFFGGLPLNRLAWLRTSHPFLNATVVSPATRWVVFKDGNPLMASQPNPNDESQRSYSLARLPTTDVRPLLGPEPFFSQGRNLGDVAPAGVPVLDTARLHGPPVVFLGLHEPDAHLGARGSANIVPSTEFSGKTDPAAVASRIKGTPFFSLDVSKVAKNDVDDIIENSEVTRTGSKLEFMDGRAAMGHLSHVDSAIFAGAKSLVDWNSRVKFCSACGSPVYSLWAGWKLSCSSLLPWSEKKSETDPCVTATGLHNFVFPRSDPVVIAVVVNEANDKVLLGRNQRWPPKFYSALAGFVEPGESLEDTFRRELWEEAAVHVWGVQYHSTQPWPFPANIMAGYYAIADSNAPVRTDLDNELEDAKWYTRGEILSALAHVAGEDVPEPSFKLPPRNALAGVLISDWAHGRVVVGNTQQSTHGPQQASAGSAKPFQNFF